LTGCDVLEQLTVAEAHRRQVLGDFQSVLAAERRAIEQVENSLNERIVDAFDLLKNCRGHVVVTGMGKAGLVGRKISATFSSSGTPSFFLHPAEACHGDLGSVSDLDVLLALSVSGETDEVTDVVAAVRRRGIPVLAVTRTIQSTIARLSGIVVELNVPEEADPLDCLPTSSTTAMLALGDAFAIALMKSRSFNKTDFSKLHPAGLLGRRLLWRISELMHAGSEVPIVPQNAVVSEALLEVSCKRLGATFITNESGRLLGIFTDGDLRRLLQANPNPLNLLVSEVMTTDAKTITQDRLACEALDVMKANSVTVLPVLDNKDDLVGAIHLHDLTRAGFR
jgi:arabinose-5-phosphate isomerase